MDEMHAPEAVREAVRAFYGRIASDETAGCGCGTRGGGCGGPGVVTGGAAMGYTAAELESVPEGANPGLGCGNPQAIAALGPGETVIDLGSGAGFDCLLAARAVGPDGRVIGVDMTPEMLRRARANAERAGLANVDFRLGEIEHLPVGDAVADVVISNCVVNLSPDKARVFAEAFRALRPGGRIAIADVVAPAALPAEVRTDLELHAACVAGAATPAEIEQLLLDAGFADIEIEAVADDRDLLRAAGDDRSDRVVSAAIRAVRPNAE